MNLDRQIEKAQHELSKLMERMKIIEQKLKQLFDEKFKRK